jgi:Cytidylate kinase-like family
MKSLGASELDLTADMIERRMRLRDAQLLTERENRERVSLFRYKFLTVTRDGGSLADEIVRELAGRLGWHVFDKEIVNHIAEHSHVRENLVRQLDERSQGLIQDTILRMLRMPEYPSFGAEEYHAALLKTLAYISTRGNAILVGRGANFALRAEKEGLNVRLTGSLEARAMRIAEKLKLKPEEARDRARSEDDERRKFIHQYFRQDIDDVRFYDLMFNTDRLSVKEVVSSIMAVLRRPQLV